MDPIVEGSGRFRDGIRHVLDERKLTPVRRDTGEQ